MTKIDTSTEAIERKINDLWERAGAAEARSTEKLLRAILSERDALKSMKEWIITERDATFALMLDRAEKAETERDALQAEVDRLRAQPVKVKPLVWTQKDGALIADDTIFGSYTIYQDSGSGWFILRDGHDDSFVTYPNPDDDFGFETEQAAQDWMTGYYEARILSSIETGETK